MRRGILITLLAAGAAFGFALGFGRIYAWHHYGHGPGFRGGRHAIEERAADACVRAAERVFSQRQAAAAKP
jgi:hypothetical protein